MSNVEQLSINELQNRAFGLMGRIHVLLRRETGRVTDIKYMSMNAEYCRHVLTLGAMTTNDDLRDMCAKLKELYFGELGLFARTSIKTPTAKPRQTEMRSSRVSIPVTSNSSTSMPAVDPLLVSAETAAVNQSYVGRLR